MVNKRTFGKLVSTTREVELMPAGCKDWLELLSSGSTMFRQCPHATEFCWIDHEPHFLKPQILL